MTRDSWGPCIGVEGTTQWVREGWLGSPLVRADGWDGVLLPVVDRSRDRGQAAVVRADAAFAIPARYETLERRDVAYAIRIPSKQGPERAVEDLLARPRGRPSHAPRVT